MKSMQEPPWITSPEQLEPNDDNGQPKQRPTLEAACIAFREQFKAEPWFVRVMATHADAAFFVLVADARYMPAKCKLSNWMGYGVAVALVPGAVADAERKVQPKKKKDKAVDKDQEVIESAIQAFHDKYHESQWFMGMDSGFADESGRLAIVVNVDSRYWKWGPDCPVFKHKGKTFHVVMAMLPSSLFADEGEHPLGEAHAN